MSAVSTASERSLVSILIVDAVDSTGRIAGLDPDVAEHIADATLDLIRRPIEQMGGILVTFSGDGGVAMFGWPGALEDHADRACEAAWNIQAAAEKRRQKTPRAEAPIHLRCGIHSGLVGLRELSLDATRSLDLIGGTVHLAAHLERLAEPDTITVSSDTLALCQSIIQTQPIGQTDALAKINATAHRLTGRPRRRTGAEIFDRFRNALVGREEPLGALQSALPGAGTGAAIAIVGEPGIGKSHLLATALQSARGADQSLLIAPIVANQRNIGTPFSTARAILNRLTDLDAGASTGELHERLGEITGIATAHPELLDYLEENAAGFDTTLDSKIKYRLMQGFVGAANLLTLRHPTCWPSKICTWSIPNLSFSCANWPRRPARGRFRSLSPQGPKPPGNAKRLRTKSSSCSRLGAARSSRWPRGWTLNNR